MNEYLPREILWVVLDLAVGDLPHCPHRKDDWILIIKNRMNDWDHHNDFKKNFLNIRKVCKEWNEYLTRDSLWKEIINHTCDMCAFFDSPNLTIRKSLHMDAGKLFRQVVATRLRNKITKAGANFRYFIAHPPAIHTVVKEHERIEKYLAHPPTILHTINIEEYLAQHEKLTKRKQRNLDRLREELSKYKVVKKRKRKN